MFTDNGKVENVHNMANIPSNIQKFKKFKNYYFLGKTNLSKKGIDFLLSTRS